MVKEDVDIELNSDKGKEVVHLDKGTVVFIPIVLFHKHPHYFSDPENFDINRDFRTPAFMPFIVGKHTCPGQNLAMNRALIGFCKLLKNFEFKSLSGMPDKEFLNAVSISPERTAVIQISERKFLNDNDCTLSSSNVPCISEN